MNLEPRYRYVPWVRDTRTRTAIGFILLMICLTSIETVLGGGRLGVILSISATAWTIAVLFTDKYTHKYAQRYYTYLAASHLKASAIMAFILWIAGAIVGPTAAPPNVLWTGFLLFIFADVLFSSMRRADIAGKKAVWPDAAPANIADNRSAQPAFATIAPLIPPQSILRELPSDLDRPLIEFLETNLQNIEGNTAGLLVLDDIPSQGAQIRSAPVRLLIGRTRINDVLRLNRFLLFCVERIAMGGYFVLRYMPLENVIKNLKHRYRGLLYRPAFLFHFLWYRVLPKIPWLDTLYFSPKVSWVDSLYLSVVKRRNRVLSKAEVWGRLSLWGMKVISESTGGGERFLIAQRIAPPVENKKPSYYPVVALEKVGLNGCIIRTHKIRTMFPFSEFLQQRIFEDHGLAATGKFKDDFRLTEIGKFLRKYWLDELPQIFDWLRGDIKLVGIRATSRHFLTLYPKHFLDLYLQTKPGLIPPIFSESTRGFDQIVEVELTYLRRYREKPIRTDMRYLIQTFSDIFFKGIRSR